MNCSTIRGTVVVEGSSTPFADLRVRLGTLRGTRFRLLGEARTDVEGAFSFDLNALSLVHGSTSLIEVRVYSNEERLSAHGDVRWRSTVDPGPLAISAEPIVAEPVPPDQPPHIPGNGNVYGHVRHSDGTPLSDLLVAVREITVHSEVPLAMVSTDSSGWYSAKVQTTKGIQVKVFEHADPPDEPRLIGVSRALFDPEFPSRLDVDICEEAFRQSTEWNKLGDALAPLLGNTTPENLGTREIAVLSGQAGWDVERIALWAMAHRFGQTIPADVESVYGLLRTGFPRNLESMLARPRVTVGPSIIRAARNNFIAGTKATEPAIEQLRKALSGAFKGALKGNRDDTLGRLLRASDRLSNAQINEFVDAYVERKGTEAEFWDKLPSLPSFDDESLAEAKRVVAVGTVALSYAPIAQSIFETLGDAPASAMAEIDAAGWQAIVGADRVPILPDGLPGEGEDEQRKVLAGYLAEHSERMFPAQTARTGIIATVTNGHPLKSAKDFFLNNPTFDIARSRVDDTSFVASDEERRVTKVAQRLYRVAPEVGRAAAMDELAKAGFTSAWSIARQTRARFVALQATSLGADAAEEVARKAAKLNAVATTFYMQGHPTTALSEFEFLPRRELDSEESLGNEEFPGYEDIFGTAGACECLHCRSVHGPAAYLVDLLRWLEDRPVAGQSSRTLYDELLDRRPDLVEIGLSCENTERSLPYIDLVLEALESAVSHSGEIEADAAHDSVATTPEMLATPQHRNDAGYVTLASAKQAVVLPFHRPLEEARTFLRHLGVSRPGLLRSFDASNALTTEDVAAEQIGLFAQRLATITDPTGSELDYWPVAALPSLAPVMTFRRVAAVSWPDILDLLHTRYANPRTWDKVTASWKRRLRVTATDSCNIETYKISQVSEPPFPPTLPPTKPVVPPTEADWTRVRQFLRLWRTLGWSVLELDKVLDALGVADLHADDWLTELSFLHRLVELTELSPVELAMVRATQLDTYEDRDSLEEPVPSLYDRSFLSPAAIIEGDPEREFFVLNALRNGLEKTGEVIADHADAVAGALGLTRDDLDTLRGRLPSDELALTNLTTLYAWNVVGKATSLSSLDVVALVDLTGLAPLSSLGDLVELVEIAEELAAAEWTVDQLRYVLRHERIERVGPTDEFVQLALGKVRDALRASFESLGDGVTETSVREEALRVLAEQMGTTPDMLNSLRTLHWSRLPTLSADTEFTLAEAARISVSLPNTEVPARTRVVLPAGAAVIRNGTPETLSEDTEVFIGEAPLGGAVATQLAYAQGTHWRRQTDGSALLPDGLASHVLAAQVGGGLFTSLDGDKIELSAPSSVTIPDGVFLESAGDVLGHLEFDSQPFVPDLLQRFLRDEFRTGNSTPDTPYGDIVDTGLYADDYSVFRALHKAVLILDRLDLDDEERAYWFAEATTVAWSLASVDELSGDAAASFGFDELKRLIDLFGTRQELPGTTPTFVELLETALADASSFAVALSARTDWREEDVAVLAAQPGAEPSSVDGLRTVLERLALVRRIGADASTVSGWAVAPEDVTAEASAQVVAAARARHVTEEAWSNVARPIRDVLRTAQRDALVAWLMAVVGNEQIEDAEDLYEHYLIDVSMNPEMLTSRIVQASATVQLFVHRLMLGLERAPDGQALFEPNAEDRELWEWMRTYRVWEAAKKVFLYPEQWIEPELRDDKSPFFRDLEKELAQGDVTEERVEQAVVDYLDRLREVGNLELLAYTWQKEDLKSSGGDDIDVLHVFARTRNEPPSYWYRRFESQQTWTAWESIECGVEGSHLLPVIYERRLLLIWASFGEACDEGSEDTYQEVRLSWSEYRDARWSPKRVSGGARVNLADPESTPSSLMLVQDRTEAERLTLRLMEHSATSDFETQALGVWWIVTVSFELDPCTLELIEVPVAARSVTRVGAVDTFWSTTGFSTREAGGEGYWASSLVAYRAAVGSGGEPSGSYPDYNEVALLEDPGTIKLIALPETYDFVSQAPFFVQSSTKSWLVWPEEFSLFGDPLVAGPIGSLGDGRRGTRVPWTRQPPTNSEDLMQWSGYLPESHYTASRTLAAVATLDEALIDTATPMLSLVGSGDYQFSVFYHPHVCTFIEAVRRGGVFALLDPDPDGPESSLATGSLRRQQLVGSSDGFDFAADLAPNPDNANWERTREDVDFSEPGSYSLYNMELFFHVPLYVACRFLDTGRHEEALRFLHAIFDPRVPDSDLPPGAVPTARWWKVAPLMEPISAPVTDWAQFTGTNDSSAAADFARQVEEWMVDPFNPHLLARLRPGTYQKVTVMKYVENLIAWGDKLFARDTLESVNEAIQLYVFARQVLGRRPEMPEPREAPETKTYRELRDLGFDALGNVLLENAFPFELSSEGRASSVVPTPPSPNFCVPYNAELLSYWDTIEDRLFKARNGMNIEGVVRTLPLFSPPIDPALLVRAAAAGIDIGTALDGMFAPLPQHKFQVLLGRASSLAGSVRALGQSLLVALEKQDAESLANVRQEQELALLNAVEEVRDRQVEEARRSRDALRLSHAVVKTRKRYYDKLIEKSWIVEETAAADRSLDATWAEIDAGANRLAGSIASIVPDFHAGMSSSVKTGGENVSRVHHAMGEISGIRATAARGDSAYLSTAAGYKRRAQEWTHQSEQAGKELAQLKEQIEAARIRLQIAERERENHRLQVSHSQQFREFLSRKFTNEDLYRWMSSQLGTLYFQQYQLALATAKKAQACYNHELGRTDSFIQPLYWDSLRKGLLAGDRLAADLERMDLAYLEHDRRELELTKSISLARLDPLALARLRVEGECFFECPEALFDLDCPGHYNRRLRSVAVSVACVAGGQGQVNVRLTLHGSQVRRTTGELETEATTYPSIVTSSAMEDGGVSPAGNERGHYLPFERLGAVSRWHLAFSNLRYPQLDWGTVTDVVLHMQYTARDAGELFRGQVLAELPAKLEELQGGFVDAGMSGTSSSFVVGLSAKRDDPDAWMKAQEEAADTIMLALGSSHLPYFAVGTLAAVPKVHVLVVGADAPPTSATVAASSSSEAVTFNPWPAPDGSSVLASTTDVGWTELTDWPDDFTLSVLSDGASPVTLDTVDDVIVLLEFTVN